MKLIITLLALVMMLALLGGCSLHNHDLDNTRNEGGYGDYQNGASSRSDVDRGYVNSPARP